MIRKLPVIFFVLIATIGANAQTGTLKGKVVDAVSGEAIPFANVVVQQNGNMVGGGVSDFDGNYTVKPVPAGRFTVKASYVGYNSLQVNDVIVYSDKIRFLDLHMNSSTQEIKEVDVIAYTVPLIDKDNTSTGGTVTSEEISKMAGRSAEAVASTVGGVYQEDGQVKSIRGARQDATVYYIDGVKVRGSNNLPKASIAEVSVVTGGQPAKYGDATGGVISIVTKGASRTFFGGFELATSKFLDPYNSNIAAANLSGPLITRKIVDPNNPKKVTKEPILGFFVAGEYQYAKDPNPSAVGFWKVKDNILDSIKRTPYIRPGGGDVSVPTASYLHADDFENVKARENVARQQAMFSGKLDFQPLKNLVFTFGGNFQFDNGNYLGGNGKGSLSGSAQTGIFNYENNGQLNNTTYRVYGRMTHHLGSQNNGETESSLFKNAYYTIQADYSKYLSKQQDENHKDNFFDYGYVGKFKTYSRPTYQYGTDTSLNLTGYIMNNIQDTVVTYQPGTLNPELARITEIWYDYFGNPLNKTDLSGLNGLLNGQTPGAIYNMVQQPGVPYSSYAKTDDDQFRISATGSTDIGDHEISAGFEFEKRTDRYYGLAPIGLWQLARNYMNNHILELNLGNPIPGYITDENGNQVLGPDGNPIFNDTINYSRLYNKAAQSLFDIKFRESQGLSVDGTEFVDVDSYDPDQLKLEYFSADELYNNSNSAVYYYGFDPYGNKTSAKPGFDEFFSNVYNYGGKQWYSRNIAPFEPIYMAGYIQDKFAFNDLVFNVGVRVDRYDANQKVQKDPYLVYTAYKAGDNDGTDFGKGILNQARNNGTIPENINPAATVYVDNREDAKTIVGYRYEDKWFDAAGNQINDPSLIYQNGSIQPYLKRPQDRVGDKSFLDAFEDYKPDFSVMPRISFSFPISDEALFFAHYDILTKRPAAGISRLNPIDYLFIEQKGADYFSNPNLRPEKTIDYEFGFQQKLNNKSSLKLSAFYREQRDMVQVINLTGAYPISMRTYGNIDFGTIKGFTFMYDLRRTENVSLKASYTLQFANATGSDATTGASLINSGQPNLRAALPTDFDQRHAFSVLLDYRFGSGQSYNGPRWFGTDIFENAGANFTINSGSGTPYTYRDINSGKVQGSVNGSVMPWRTTINMKVDKSFTLHFGEGDDVRSADLNVYLDVTNLLNTRNILGVYSSTGNANDDAYLTSSSGIAKINSAYDMNAFINYYLMMLDNPANYNLPRQIRLGVIFSF